MQLFLLSLYVAIYLKGKVYLAFTKVAFSQMRTVSALSHLIPITQAYYRRVSQMVLSMRLCSLSMATHPDVSMYVSVFMKSESPPKCDPPPPGGGVSPKLKTCRTACPTKNKGAG